MELKNISKIFFLVIFFGLTQWAHGQKLYEKHKESLPYSFWVYEPEGYDKKQDWPMIIFLHGRSLSGNDLSLVKKYGVIAEIGKGRKFPAVIIAPQVAKGESWSPDKIVACVNYMKKNYRIDSSRVSVTGMSLGGYGTLHTIGKYPDVFSCGAAFCGGGKASDACKLSGEPLWIAHGTKDEKVPFSESSTLVEKIKNCNDDNIKFTIFQDGNHGVLERMFRTEELYEFLLNNQNGKPAFFPKYPDKK